MDIYSQKYIIKYNYIIKHYKALNLKKSKDLYTESHHIIPKSMGGSNHKDNLVRVTARVHFLLHWMLYRIYRTPSMVYAWSMMCIDKTSNRYTSKSYAYARSVASYTQSNRIITKETRYKISQRAKNRKHSINTKNKISASVIGNKNPFFNKTHSEETKTKISIANKGKPSKLLGIPKSAITKLNMSLSHLTRPISTCPHCNKSSTVNMTRWHFDNCKYKLLN